MPERQSYLIPAALFTLLTAFLAARVASPATAQERAISLAGIIDFHAHAGPDSRPRSLNDIEAARLIKQAGLRGMVLKNHFTMTADRAALAMAQVEGLEIFGGVALNRAIGGINPEAVRQMVAFDGGRGKVVWLDRRSMPSSTSLELAGPSRSSGSWKTVYRLPRWLMFFRWWPSMTLVLAMGHSSPEEVLVMIPAAKRLGVRHILVTHVFGQGATLDQMRQMAGEGAVMELDWLAVHTGDLLIEDYTTAIGEIGAQHFLISSDLGQTGNPPHADGLRSFIRALIDAGVTEAQIDRMARNNPARLLGLE